MHTQAASPFPPPPFLSSLHKTLSTVRREFDSRRHNEILNDPSVLPYVRGTLDRLDTSGAVANRDNILLMGEHGCVLFMMLQRGLYEAHSAALPAGRGRWMAEFCRAATHWMFTRSDCIEVMTRCPTIQSKALARHLGWVKEFTNANGWVVDGKNVPADVYAVRLWDWWKTAPGLTERGEWFHDRLNEEYKRLTGKVPTHGEDDGSHDRVVGLVTEMFLNGQPDKACILYNRWAALADHHPISMVSYNPVAVDIGGAILIVQGDGFYVASVLDPETLH